MHRQLDANFETMALLSLCPWNEKAKNDLIAQIDKLGVDGLDFYKQNFRIIEQYYHTFEKYIVTSPGVALLQDMEDIVFAINVHVIRDNQTLISDIENFSDEALQTAIDSALRAEFAESGSSSVVLVDVLEALELSDRAKWQLVLLQQKAKTQLRLIAQAVSDNIPAFEKAYKKIESEIGGLLQQFDQILLNPKTAGILQQPARNENTTICPTMALPVALMIIDDIWYYGLLSYKLSGGTELTRNELFMGAKALSEKSKLEILLSLKEASRYNLEIAELVNLSAATVSHHMNVLIASGFVELEKRDGKVYYRLAENGIRCFLNGVRHLLLSGRDTNINQ